MSVQIQDDSVYSSDMDDLSDLISANVPVNPDDDEKPAFDSSFLEHAELVEDDTPLDRKATVKPSTKPATVDWHASKAQEFMKEINEPEVAKSSSSDEDWGFGDKPTKVAAKPDEQKTWFGSGGKSDDDDDKKALLCKIAAYRTNFPFLNDEITFPTKLHKKNVEQLEDIVKECSSRVQSRNMLKGLRIFFNGTMGAVEDLCTTQFGLSELQGFARNCEMNQVIQDSILELEIKYFSARGVMAPEWRLIMGIMLCAVTTVSNNRAERKIREVCVGSARPLPDSFSDL